VASTRELQARIFKDSEAHKRQMTPLIKSGDKMKEWQQDQQEAIRQLQVAQKPQYNKRSNLRSKPSLDNHIKETSLSPYMKLGQARTPA